MEERPKRHSWPQTLVLHLAPGVLNLSFTLLALSFLLDPFLPPVLVFGVLTNVFVLIPVQLGWLFYLARKRGNPWWSFEGIVVYQSRTTMRRLLVLVPAIIVCTFIIFSTLDPLTKLLQNYASYSIPSGYEGVVSDGLLWIVFALNIAFTAFFVPITEELYFRGYLLPRMPSGLGRGAPVVHSFLFAVYHFDTPWMIPVRTLGLLPLIYATLSSRSVRAGVVSHCLVNLYGVVESVMVRFR